MGLFVLLPEIRLVASSCLVWKQINTLDSLFLSVSLYICHLFLCQPFFYIFFSQHYVSHHLSTIQTPPVSPQKSSGRGELLLSLCYQSTTNTLTVVVLKARHLPKTENNGPTGKYIFKIYLYKMQSSYTVCMNFIHIAINRCHIAQATLDAGLVAIMTPLLH